MPKTSWREVAHGERVYSMITGEPKCIGYRVSDFSDELCLLYPLVTTLSGLVFGWTTDQANKCWGMDESRVTEIC